VAAVRDPPRRKVSISTCPLPVTPAQVRRHNAYALCRPDLVTSRASSVLGHEKAVGGEGADPHFKSCAEELAHACGGTIRSDGDSLAVPHCNGHGVCTTDWKKCGSGGANVSATPCCSCDVGFAGETCASLDARMYVAIGAGSLLALLVLLMIVARLARALAHGLSGQAGQMREHRRPLLASR